MRLLLFLILLFLFFMLIPSYKDRVFLLRNTKKIYFAFCALALCLAYFAFSKQGYIGGKYIPAHFNEDGILVKEQVIETPETPAGSR